MTRKEKKTEIPYNFMPAEQHFGSPEELLGAIEHYQQTRAFADGDERFNAQEDKFEKLLKEDGGGVLMPIARDYAFLYRGQGGFYNPCLPTLFRTKRDPDHLFLERMRIVEFELMLKQYPSVQFFEQERFEVDYVGLAQHYGLNTDVLDLTSDIQTALFFAMCDYDRVADCYHPKFEDKEYVGYVYAFPVIGEIMNNQGIMDGSFLMHDLRVIGLQPFSRPGSQRSFSLHVDESKPFKAYLYSFSTRSPKRSCRSCGSSADASATTHPESGQARVPSGSAARFADASPPPVTPAWLQSPGHLRRPGDWSSYCHAPARLWPSEPSTDSLERTHQWPTRDARLFQTGVLLKHFKPFGLFLLLARKKM